MPAYNLSVDDVLAKLRQNNSFSNLPQDWQIKLAGQVHDNGLDATIAMNKGWLQGNSRDPLANSVGAWLSSAPQSKTALETPVTPVTPATPTATAIPANLSDADFLAAVAQNGGDPGADQASFARLAKLADAGNAQATKLLTDAGYENSSPTTNMPVEQGLQE